jgi:hypothetical protein
MILVPASAQRHLRADKHRSVAEPLGHHKPPTSSRTMVTKGT